MTTFNFLLKKIKNNPLALILLLALIIRVSLMIVIILKNPDGIYLYDSFGYWQLGYNIFHHGIFSQGETFPFESDYYRTPVYPLFIAFAESIGPEGFSIIILQIIVSIITCYFTYLTAKLITQKTFIAYIAALTMALDLPSVSLANLVLTETLFSLLFLICIYFFIRFLQQKKTWQLLLTALFSGLIILCRPIAIFIPFLFSLFLIFHFRKSVKTLFANTFLYALITLLSISPWLIRNKITFDHYFISVIRQHDLLNYQAAAIYSERFGYPLAESQSILRWKTFREFNGNAHKQPYEYAVHIQKEAMNLIYTYPVIFLKHHIKEIGNFFFKPCRAYFNIQSGYWGRGYYFIPAVSDTFDGFIKYSSKYTIGLVIIQVLMMAAIYISCLAGCFYFQKMNLLLYFTLIAAIIFCFANMNLPHVTESRFKVPIQPLLAIISACGIYYWKEKYFGFPIQKK